MQCHDNFKQTTALLRTKHLLQRHWILTPLATTLPSTSPPPSRQRPDQKSEAPIQKCEASIQICSVAHQKVLTTKASPFRHFFFYYVHFYGCIFFLSHILFFTNYFLFFLTIFHTLFLLLPFFTYFFLHVFSARIFLHIFFYTSIFSILFWRDQNNILTAFRNSADLHLFNDFFFSRGGIRICLKFILLKSFLFVFLVWGFYFYLELLYTFWTRKTDHKFLKGFYFWLPITSHFLLLNWTLAFCNLFSRGSFFFFGFMNGDAMEFGNDFICGVICCFLFLFHWLNLVLIFVWGTLILKRFQFDWLAINYLF